MSYRALILLLALSLGHSKLYAQHGIEHSTQGPIIELSEQTRAAIDSGVSLTFEAEYAQLKRFLFFKWAATKQVQTFRISRHALSDRYLVYIDNDLKPAIFRSSTQAMTFITKKIHREYRRYVVDQPKAELRLSLNKYKLPAPIRLTAFISQDWDYNSGWSAWQLDK